ncbi:hypothetical protein [Massilia oculi]|uniref:hypothetical protein n=1 Tax=Massilia oculi TaxID=945844 RepID=UPI0028A72C9D|nr:hypothetical protein [Massilia oculi]
MTQLSKYFSRSRFKTLHLFNLIAFLLLLVIGCALGLGLVSATSFVPLAGSSLLSTFLGASFAFHLNTQKDLNKEQDQRIAALQTALFILAQQFNAVGGSWKSIAKWGKEPHRWVNMPAMGQPDYKNLQQDFSSLAFILAEDAQLLLDLSVEDERFLQLLRSMKERSDFYTKEIHEAIEKARAGKTQMSLPDLRTGLGDRLFFGAQSRTDDVFMHVTESMKSLPGVANRLRTYAKAKYPEAKFLVVELEDGSVPPIA